MPNGRQRCEWIKRSADIEALAQKLIDFGWRFECEMLSTGEISLTIFAIEEEEDVCIEIIPNGLEVLDAVDRLVNKGHALCLAQPGQLSPEEDET